MLFRSTRWRFRNHKRGPISIHEVFANLDFLQNEYTKTAFAFQSTRSSQTSTDLFDVFSTTPKISIHEVFANLDATSTPPTFCLKISIHEVFANLDRLPKGYFKYLYDFNPRGLRKPRQEPQGYMTIFFRISIHEVFANLDESIRAHKSLPLISIHEVFANLDAYGDLITVPPFSFQSTRSSQTSTTISDILTPVRWNFNPRGLRKPRPVRVKPDIAAPRFQSTRSSQTST